MKKLILIIIGLSIFLSCKLDVNEDYSTTQEKLDNMVKEISDIYVKNNSLLFDITYKVNLFNKLSKEEQLASKSILIKNIFIDGDKRNLYVYNKQFIIKSSTNDFWEDNSNCTLLSIAPVYYGLDSLVIKRLKTNEWELKSNSRFGKGYFNKERYMKIRNFKYQDIIHLVSVNKPLSSYTYSLDFSGSYSIKEYHYVFSAKDIKINTKEHDGEFKAYFTGELILDVYLNGRHITHSSLIYNRNKEIYSKYIK